MERVAKEKSNARILYIYDFFLYVMTSIGIGYILYQMFFDGSPDKHIIENPVFLLIMEFFNVSIGFMLVGRALPKPITKEEIMFLAKELQEQMDILKQENERLSKQLRGETSNDEGFAQIINDTIDYLQKSPEEQIVTIRGYLLYIYRGNNEILQHSIRTLMPNNCDTQHFNIYGGENQILPEARWAKQTSVKEVREGMKKK